MPSPKKTAAATSSKAAATTTKVGTSAVDDVEYRPLDSNASTQSLTTIANDGSQVQLDKSQWDHMPLPAVADVTQRKDNDDGGHGTPKKRRDAASKSPASKRTAGRSPASKTTKGRRSVSSGGGKKSMSQQRRKSKSPTKTKKKKRSFYAIRSCDGLNAPAIFFDEDDYNFYIDQNDDDDDDDDIEVLICDNILDAMEFIDESPKGSLLTKLIELYGGKKAAAAASDTSSTSRKRSSAAATATDSTTTDSRRKKRKKSSSNEADSGTGAAAASRRDQNWEDNFEKLRQFHERHGHANVPRTPPEGDDTDPTELLKLHRWLHYIKTEWDKYHEDPKSVRCLDSSRVSRLHALGIQGIRRVFRRPVDNANDSSNANAGGDTGNGDDQNKEGGSNTTPAASNLDLDGEIRLTQRELKWEEKFDALRKYKEEHGTFEVDPQKDIGLRRWVRYMCEKKALYDEDPMKAAPSLTESRVQRLQELGFDFTFVPIKRDNPKPENQHDDTSWDEYFEQLKKFHEEHGHTDVRHDVHDDSTYPLRKWILRQRAQYDRIKMGKPSTLTKERMDLLTSIGFSLTPKVKRLSFDERAVQWLEYRQKHGKDPSRENGDSLGIWVSKTRTKYARLQAGDKKCNITQEQADRLTSWGFKWDSGVKRPTKITKPLSWEERFQQLVEYKEKHGHTVVPQLYPELGMWVHRQRRDYKKMVSGKKNYMTQEKLEKLQSIGFVFHAKQSGARGMLRDPEEQELPNSTTVGNTAPKRKTAKPRLPIRPRKNQILDDDSDDDDDENDSQDDHDDNGSMTSEEGGHFNQYGQHQPVAAAAAMPPNNNVHMMQYNTVHNQQHNYRHQHPQQQQPPPHHHHPNMYYPS